MEWSEYTSMYEVSVFHWAHAKTRISTDLCECLNLLKLENVQVLYVNTEEITKESCFDALCELLKVGTVWALNVGEASFSINQCRALHDTILKSNVAFMFLDAILVGKDTVRKFKDVIRDRRRNTVTAPWIISDDDKQNNIILRCRNMWFSPCALGRNKKKLSELKF